jgi:uncharacterized YigZ family protein
MSSEYSILDHYLTIAQPSEGEFKDKGSKFLSFAFPFHQENDLDEIIAKLKSIHPKARHYCFAYRIGTDMNRYRTNDDGEPSGTAGKPIFGQIQSYNITNVIIVVIRYFGGVKLGVSGLINAYKEAAKDALAKAKIIEDFCYFEYALVFDYDQMGYVMNALKSCAIDITQKSFGNAGQVIIRLRWSEEKPKLNKFKATLLNLTIDEISDDTKISFCSIQKL